MSKIQKSIFTLISILLLGSFTARKAYFYYREHAFERESRLWDMNIELQKANAHDYQISNAVKANELYRQRTIEGSWPLRPNLNSPFIYVLKSELSEANFQKCSVLWEKNPNLGGQDLVLAHCNP